jgi:uncharacterized protein (DUF1330 family)
MTTYLTIDLNPTDAEAIRDYEERMPPLLERFGARVLARDESPLILEGERVARIAVLIAFDDRESLLRWYDSEEYAPLRAQRWRSAETAAVVLDGPPVS